MALQCQGIFFVNIYTGKFGHIKRIACLKNSASFC